jgi:hypothetical protein
MSQPTRAKFIAAVVALLRAGVPTRELPVRLIADYHLPPERAGELAAEAITRWCAEGKPDATRPAG